MKIVICLFISSLVFSCQAETKKNLPVNKAEVSKPVVKTPGVKEEDCDDKAKKPIEIKEETISLSGNTGCSLDEINK